MLEANKNLSEGYLSVKNALSLIRAYIHETPLINSESLNKILGHNFFFKAESLQKTGAFKVRGVLHHMLVLKKNNLLPEKIVAYSTGNHAIGVSWVANKLGIKARVYLPKDTAILKQKQAEFYGAEVVYTQTRKEAEEKAFLDGEKDFYYVHPSDSDITILGAGTVCLEALNQMKFSPDAIFASCGGGGLLSGCYLAKEEFDNKIKIFGSEPKNANDAAISIKNNNIFSFSNSPNTIADGLKTLKLSNRTFEYLKKIDKLYEIEESEIEYWTVWLMHLLKLVTEPSCAINMASAIKWLKENNFQEKKNILIILSGGNLDPHVMKELFDKNYLTQGISSLL